MCGTVISETTAVARKNHRCEACADLIPRGVLYVRSFAVDGDEKSFSKWHIECREEFCEMLYRYGDDCGDPLDTWESGHMPAQIWQRYFQGPIEERA